MCVVRGNIYRCACVGARPIMYASCMIGRVERKVVHLVVHLVVQRYYA